MQAAHSKLKSVTIEATITRAGGQVEAPQIVAFWHANPLKQMIWALRRKNNRKDKH